MNGMKTLDQGKGSDYIGLSRRQKEKPRCDRQDLRKVVEKPALVESHGMGMWT
jgi:hypothetical protein